MNDPSTKKRALPEARPAIEPGAPAVALPGQPPAAALGTPSRPPRPRGLGWLSAALLLLLLAGLAVPAATNHGLADQRHEIGLERVGFRAMSVGADLAGDAAAGFRATAGEDRPLLRWRGVTPGGSPPARAPTI